MIKNYYQYITEGRQRGPLYHVLSIDSLKHVINNNAITGHHYRKISTTRNKMLNSYIGSRPSAFFKLEIDGNKLSNDYKIKPFVYKSQTRVRLEEQEEQVQTNNIKDAFNYINKVIIIKDMMENARNGSYAWQMDDDIKKPLYWFTSDVREGDSMQKFIKWVKENSEAPLYVQDGSKIYKDDEYINSLITEPVYTIDYGYALYYRGRTEIINDDLFSMKEALFPVDDRNRDILQPVMGYNYEDLHLMNKDEVLSKLNNYDFIKGIDRVYPGGEPYKEKFELYFLKFQLHNQENLPKDGFVKKAKMDDMTPASWIADRLAKSKAA